MKKLSALFILVASITITCSAQSHSDHISFGTGLLYERGLDATVSWEHETLYHNSWEYFFNAYLKWDECESCGHICPESFWNNYNTWGIGAAYKPCVWRSRNNHGNIRIGVSAGSNTNSFIGGIHLGYEHSYSLHKGWVLYWQAKCDMIIPDREDLFRTGIVVGIKIPTFNH